MSRQLSFTDYDGFVEKFKPKNTTDDCYTPPAVYEAVLDYVDRNVTPLDGREVVRPFWPGGFFFVGENYNNYNIGASGYYNFNPLSYNILQGHYNNYNNYNIIFIII